MKWPGKQPAKRSGKIRGEAITVPIVLFQFGRVSWMVNGRQVGDAEHPGGSAISPFSGETCGKDGHWSAEKSKEKARQPMPKGLY